MFLAVDPPKSVSVSVRPSGEIVEGGPVILTCSSDANPAVEDYAWYKGTTFIGTGKQYFIRRASSEDSGEYKCEARNRYGEKNSDGATLIILGKWLNSEQIADHNKRNKVLENLRSWFKISIFSRIFPIQFSSALFVWRF